jgi:hypothetical protein
MKNVCLIISSNFSSCEILIVSNILIVSKVMPRISFYKNPVRKHKANFILGVKSVVVQKKKIILLFDLVK